MNFNKRGVTAVGRSEFELRENERARLRAKRDRGGNNNKTFLAGPRVAGPSRTKFNEEVLLPDELSVNIVCHRYCDPQLLPAEYISLPIQSVQTHQ